jgi:hypothetical protein
VIVPNVRTTSARGLRSTLAHHDQHDHTASNRRDADKRWERHGHDIMERRRGALQTEILKLEEEPARFVAAIPIAGDVEALAEALREGSNGPHTSARNWSGLSVPNSSVPLTSGGSSELRKHLADWREPVLSENSAACPSTSYASR